MDYGMEYHLEMRIIC